MRFRADFSGEAASRHTCHCTDSNPMGMSRAWPVTVHDDHSSRSECLYVNQYSRSGLSSSVNAEQKPSSALFSKPSQGGLPECDIDYTFVLTFPLQIVIIRIAVPLNSILFSLSVLVITTLINTESTATLNTIIALLTAATSIPHVLSISCILLKRLKGKHLPPCHLSLGRIAIPCNTLALGYVITAAVASFFPVTVPKDAENMDWSPLILRAVLFIACTDYLVRGRKLYIELVRQSNKM